MPFVVCYLLPITCCLFAVANYVLLEGFLSSCLLVVMCCCLLFVLLLLFVVWCSLLLFVCHCLTFVTRCLLFVVADGGMRRQKEA